MALPLIIFAQSDIPPEVMATEFMKRILTNDEIGNIELAVKYSKLFDKWLKDQPQKYSDKYKEPNLKLLAALHGKQGNYNEAIKSLKQLKTWKPSSVSTSDIEKFEQRKETQKAFFQKKDAFLTKQIKLDKEMLKMLEHKNRLISKAENTNSGELSSDELKKLQNEIKKSNKLLSEIYQKKKNLKEQYRQEIEKLNLKNLYLSAKMLTELKDKSDQSNLLLKEIVTQYDKSKNSYFNMAEKHKIGWKGLQESISEMLATLKEVKELQNQLLALMKEKKLSKEQKKEFLLTKMKLDKALKKLDQKSKNLDETFANADNFIHINNSEIEGYKKMFSSLKELEKELAQNTKKIQDFSINLDYKYGDVNQDGKIDGYDYTLVSRYLSTNRTSPLYKDAVKRIDPLAADVDGDGRITYSDLGFIQEASFGSRVVFPVDPKNKKGDMNGDGFITDEDTQLITQAVKQGDRLKTSWKTIVDVDGNGEINIEDLKAFFQTKEAEEKESNEENIDSNNSEGLAPVDYKLPSQEETQKSSPFGVGH